MGSWGFSRKFHDSRAAEASGAAFALCASGTRVSLTPGFIIVLQTLLAADPPHALLVGFLATVAIATITSAAALEASRRSRQQHQRADRLARDLSRINANVQRRLNFLNAISHDLRTPLNGIALQTHIIEKALTLNDQNLLRKCASDIRTSAVLAAEILDALLQYAQTDMEQNALAEVPLRDLLAQVADTFRAAAEEKRLVFTLDVPEGLMLRTDRHKLQRIIANLFDNAVKFTQRGSIALHARAGEDDAIAIEIVDTGPGITTDHLEHVFHEFFQANNPSRDARLGLGLGLVVARRLAAQLGGTLEAASEVGRGSTFRVILPRSAPQPPPAGGGQSASTLGTSIAAVA